MDLKGILYEPKCNNLLEARINMLRNLKYIDFGQNDYQNGDKKKFFLEALQKYYADFDKVYTALTGKFIKNSLILAKLIF